ncbi:hypothetical protein BOX15_Mlig023762g1 [Macrostomum lignano]|uniref:Uncharacterized protein n=1 Tax=Macrostomum lignano TaxID=282301 RepID=A0A267G922_9PLAT|nr:hypothetical protein BOX15_Mlig023762g1 [Macrostomum lignano]
MAANSDEDNKIPCKLHVLARLKRIHRDDEGRETDREISIEVGTNKNNVKTKKMTCTASESDKNFAKWNTSEPTKHKPLEVNFLLSRKEANKSKKTNKGDIYFKEVTFEIFEKINKVKTRDADANAEEDKSAAQRTLLLKREFKPKFMHNITEFILYISEETDQIVCTPVLPVRLLISCTSESLSSYPLEITKKPVTSSFGGVDCLNAEFLLRVDRISSQLKTFDGEDLCIGINGSNYSVILKVQSFELFRHYYIFHLQIGSDRTTKVTPPSVARIELNFTVTTAQLEINEELYLVASWLNSNEIKMKTSEHRNPDGRTKLTCCARTFVTLPEKSGNMKNEILKTLTDDQPLEFKLKIRRTTTTNTTTDTTATTATTTTTTKDKEYPKKQLNLAAGIEPGILTYNIYMKELDVDPIVTPYMPTYQLPREQILQYFHSLLRNVAGLSNYLLKDVKTKYAQRLVPQVRLDGGYDIRYHASRPYEIHDIWKLTSGEIVEVSAIEYCSQLGLKPEHAEKTTKAIRSEVIGFLTSAYKERENEVFEDLRQMLRDFKFQPKEKDQPTNEESKEYFQAIIKAGKSLRISAKRSEISDERIDLMMQKAAAIVRGRLEAFLVSPEFNRLTSKHYGEFRRHLDAAGVWFAFLMLLHDGTPDLQLNLPLVEDFDVDLTGIPLKMNHMPRDGILWYFYSVLNGQFSDKVPEWFRKFAAIKKIFAQPLVPKITIEGEYDGRWKRDELLENMIWGEDNKDVKDLPCALQRSDHAFEKLKEVFEKKEEEIYQLTEEAEDINDPETLKKLLNKLAEKATALSYLEVRLKAIVRGRCESLLVNPQLSHHDKESEGVWKKEIGTIGLWFCLYVFCCAKNEVPRCTILIALNAHFKNHRGVYTAILIAACACALLYWKS